MKASNISILIFAAAILIVGADQAFARGGHGHARGYSADGFPLLHAAHGAPISESPMPFIGLPSHPAKGGGHEGETPFAIPSYGSPNVENFPGRQP